MRNELKRLAAASTLLLCAVHPGRSQTLHNRIPPAEFRGAAAWLTPDDPDAMPYGRNRIGTAPTVFTASQDPSDAIDTDPFGHSPERPPSGSVSVRQLQHPPSRKAIQQALKARKLSDAGQHREAAEALEQAVRISPDYAEAHLNLGAEYMYAARWQEGMTESAHAMQIAGPSTLALCNTAFAQMSLGQSDDALASLRRALALDTGSAQAHYLMGVLLANSRRPVEAIEHLKLAAQSLPSARTMLDALSTRLARPRRIAAMRPPGQPGRTSS